MKCKQIAKNKFTVYINVGRCKACGLCISFCPQEGLSFDERINDQGFHPVKFSNEIECIGCGNCQLMCPDLAIVVTRKGKRRSISPGELCLEEYKPAEGKEGRAQDLI